MKTIISLSFILMVLKGYLSLGVGFNDPTYCNGTEIPALLSDFSCTPQTRVTSLISMSSPTSTETRSTSSVTGTSVTSTVGSRSSSLITGSSTSETSSMASPSVTIPPSKGPNVGAIVGGVIGALIGVCLVIGLFFVLPPQTKTRKQSTPMYGTSSCPQYFIPVQNATIDIEDGRTEQSSVVGDNHLTPTPAEIASGRTNKERNVAESLTGEEMLNPARHNQSPEVAIAGGRLRYPEI